MRLFAPGSTRGTALGLAEAGAIPGFNPGTGRTMKAFDAACLTPVEDLTPEAIRRIRLRENASQAVSSPAISTSPPASSASGSAAPAAPAAPRSSC